MTYSDSEPENNEIANDSDLEFEAEYLPHLSTTPIRERHSDSASDSSSGKSSTSKSKKKSRLQREVDNNKIRIDAIAQQNDDKFTEIKAAQLENSAKNSEVLKNQASLKSDLNNLTINQTGLMQLAKDMTVISAQNHLFQETVNSIQEGTTKLISESAVNKQHIIARAENRYIS